MSLLARRLTPMLGGQVGQGESWVYYKTLVQPDSVSGLHAWFKVEDLALADGASVASWPDASGNGRDMGGGGGAVTYEEAGWEYGGPHVWFNGGWRTAAGVPATGNNPRAIFLTHDHADNTSATYWHYIHWGSAWGNAAFGWTRTGEYYGTHYWGGSRIYASLPTVPTVFALVSNGSTTTCWINGWPFRRDGHVWATGSDYGLHFGSRIAPASEIGKFRTTEMAIYGSDHTLTDEQVIGITRSIMQRSMMIA